MIDGNALAPTAQCDIDACTIVRTTTAAGGLATTALDRVAGLYLRNPGGTLIAARAMN